jgi:hypothetical protein
VPEVVTHGAVDPFYRKPGAKPNVAVPSMSRSHEHHRETNRGSTFLETLLERLRGFFLTLSPTEILDVLWHAGVGVSLSARIPPIPFQAVIVSNENLTLQRTTSPTAVRFCVIRALLPATTSTRIPVLSP